MKKIVNCEPDSLELNALFIQPTYQCTYNCPGCYVKARSSTSHLWIIPVIRIFESFVRGEHKCSANQITVSVDAINFKDHPAQSETLCAMWRSMLLIVKRIDKNKLPEIHMTYNSLDNFKAYAARTDYLELSTEKLLNLHSMISFSNIKEKDLRELELITKYTSVNFNHLIPLGINSTNLYEYVERIRKIGEVVDSIYLIVYKELQAGQLEGEQLRAAQKRMAYDLRVINTLRKHLPKDVWSKCNIDGCIKDAAKYKDTGCGCSSNISRFQLWPEGSVTGCPYSASVNERSQYSRSLDTLKKNIKKARATYDFKNICHIRTVYDSITKGN